MNKPDSSKGFQQQFKRVRDRAAFRRATVSFAALAALLAGSAANAGPFSLEGITTAITPTRDSTGKIISVMVTCSGKPVLVDADSDLTTVNKYITYTQLVDPTPFPNSGRSPITGANRAGFLGGTCVADGLTLPDGTLHASAMTVEVAENVLVGQLTGSTTINQTPLAIQGIRINPLTDARMPAQRLRSGLYLDENGTRHFNNLTETIHNQYGFGVDPTSVGYALNTTIPDTVAATGYMGVNGQFYAYDVETTTGKVLNTQPRAALTGATGVDHFLFGNDRLNVRGGCRMSGTNTQEMVDVYGETPNPGVWQFFGSAVCTVIPLDAPHGRWKLDVNNTEFWGQKPPSRIRVNQVGTRYYDFMMPDIGLVFPVPGIAG